MSWLSDVFDTVGSVAKPFTSLLGRAAPVIGGVLGGRFGGPMGAALGSSLGQGIGGALNPQSEQEPPRTSYWDSVPGGNNSPNFLAPTPSPNVAPPSLSELGGNFGQTMGSNVGNAARNFFSNYMPSSMQSTPMNQIGQQAGNMAGNALQSRFNSMIPQEYQQATFGQLPQMFGNSFSQRINSMLPSSFSQSGFGNILGAMAGAGLQSAANQYMPENMRNMRVGNVGNELGRAGGEMLQRGMNQYVPQEFQNTSLNTLGDTMGSYGRNKFANLGEQAQQRLAGPDNPYNYQSQYGQPNMSSRKFFNTGGHVTRGLRDMVELMPHFNAQYA
jgi:hypothetical protein